MAETKKTVKKATPVKQPVAKKPVAKTSAAAKPAVAKKPPTTKVSIAKPIVAEEKKEVKVTAEKKVVAKKPAPVQKEQPRGMRKTRTGKVVSNKMNKTIVVSIVNKVPHPLYGKVVVTTTKFKAHDENNECAIGDTVEIVETRPLSKDKYFRLLRIIEKAK